MFGHSSKRSSEIVENFWSSSSAKERASVSKDKHRNKYEGVTRDSATVVMSEFKDCCRCNLHNEEGKKKVSANLVCILHPVTSACRAPTMSTMLEELKTKSNWRFQISSTFEINSGEKKTEKNQLNKRNRRKSRFEVVQTISPHTQAERRRRRAEQ